MAEQITLKASIGTTIQTRQYENVRIDMGIDGVPLDCNEDTLKTIISGANVTLQRMVDGLSEELGRRIKEDFRR